MNRTLLSLIIISATTISAFALSSAFFSNSETSTQNLLQSGAIDLKIDNTSYYNGQFWPATSWDLTDLDSSHLFLNFTDLKPGDEGEDTISIHIQNNPVWGCVDLSLTANDDTTCTEPELIDDLACNEPDDDISDGELAQSVNFIFWVDDGDNVLETHEASTSAVLDQGPADQVLNHTWVLADAEQNNVGGSIGQGLTADQAYYIGKAWCFGTLGLDPVPNNQGIDPSFDSGVTCDGSQLDSSTQTDTLTADFSFRAVQHRHNSTFTCTGIKPSPTPTPTPSITPSPSPTACINNADVMLVLDRSGSISSSELVDLKTAASDFVSALNPSPNGAHVGQSSFSTNATLDASLTDSIATVQAAIDALVRGGNTNLHGGLDLASVELSGANDRPDATAPDYYLVITDGNPNRPLPANTSAATAAATAAAIQSNPDATIYVVGIGNDVDTVYLQNQIASSPAHYYGIANYSDLSTVLQGIIEVCE